MVVNHKKHLGHSLTPIVLEMEEVDPQWIKVLGNWHPDTQQDAYSAKMPLRAMQVIAGFSEHRGSHYNPRTVLDPPISLQKMIFTEVEAVEEKIDEQARKNNHDEATTNDNNKATAKAFLQMLKNLRRIILQDVAVMMIGGRTRHTLFELDVFKTTLFLDFKKNMEEHMKAAEENNPSDQFIEVVLPGVNEKLTNITSALSTNEATTKKKLDNLEAKMSKMTHAVSQWNSLVHNFVTSFNAGTCL